MRKTLPKPSLLRRAGEEGIDIARQGALKPASQPASQSREEGPSAQARCREPTPKGGARPGCVPPTG